MNKIDVIEIYKMFETINEKLDKKTDKSAESVQIVLSTVSAVTKQLENVIEETRKPAIVEHHYRHTINIQSIWFFFSWVALVIVIFGLFWVIADQRQTIGQYKNNNLKYRYIKMHGQTNEEGLYRLEQQFKYSDSIKIIRKQVEKYEELVKEKAERLERVKRNNEEAERFNKDAESLKKSK